MREWEIASSSESASDLDEIYRYISESLLAPETAARQINRIKSAIMGLKSMPKRYPAYPEEPWKSRGYRQMPVNNYVVIYRTIDDTGEVHIIRVLYGGRDIDAVLSGME